MRVLHVNANDQSGGAARSAYRLFKGEENIGLNTRLLVFDKYIEDSHVLTYSGKYNKIRKFVNARWNHVIMRMVGERLDTPWNMNFLPFGFPLQIDDYDLVHLHWINGGLVKYDVLKNLDKPIIWTMHDSWPFTGGCHIPYECKKFESSCADCPQLKGRNMMDLASMVFRIKQKYYPKNITVVCPSNWMADCAKKSKLFSSNNVCVIPNGLDTNLYKPFDKLTARKILGIPITEKIILFGAVSATSDKNKGYQYLCKAMDILKNNYDVGNIHLLVFGGVEPEEGHKLPYPAKYFGRLYDDLSLVILYNAADVMIVPSQSENFPNSVLEAMACGTPCVAFNVGGIPDLIIHKKNGYLAKPFEEDDLARGIKFVIDNEQINEKLAKCARRYVVEKCDIRIIAEQYKQLYEKILKTCDIEK